MRKISIIFMLGFIINISYGKILGKVDLPENWEIKSSETKESHKVGNITVSKYLIQTIKASEGDLIVEYLIFDNITDLVNVFFDGIVNKKSIYIDINNKVLYTVEGSASDRKNVLRFLKLPILEQIKVVYKDIENVEKLNLEIIKERDLNNDEITSYSKEYSVNFEKAKEQVFKVKEGIGISVIFFLCKNSVDAGLAYKNSRIKNTSELVSFLLAQNFLIRLQWVKI